MKNYSKSELQSANKRLIAVVAISLALIMVASVILGVGFGVYGTDASKWFKDQHIEIPQEPQVDNSFAVNPVQGVNGLSLLSAPATVASDGQTSVTLTVTTDPVGATDALEWAIVGNEDNAITLTVASDGMSATVACNKAFDVQKTVTVTSKANAEVNASCTLDYYKRLESVSIKGLTTLKLATSATAYKVELEPHYGIGTILDTEVIMSGGTVEVINQVKNNTHATFNGMEATPTATVAIGADGNFSLVMSPSVKSSFFQLVKGAEATPLFNAYFKMFLTSCRNYKAQPQYKISVNWYATRNGGTFNNGTATVSGMFDISGLDIPANSIDLSQGNILF